VLDISKIEAGQLEVCSKPFNLSRSIQKVLAIVAPQAEAKRLEIHTEISSGLDEAVGDERRFEQVLLNLLSNAIKFTEGGQVTLRARILEAVKLPGAEAEQRALCLKVSDTGIGIKPEDLSGLFQPFRQIDSGLARNYEGTGLGLAICGRLTALMGGEIHAESEWKKGSTFSVVLPLKGPART
jgi:signal transduction histidine kinase